MVSANTATFDLFRPHFASCCVSVNDIQLLAEASIGQYGLLTLVQRVRDRDLQLARPAASASAACGVSETPSTIVLAMFRSACSPGMRNGLGLLDRSIRMAAVGQKVHLIDEIGAACKRLSIH